jgi:catechol 2,3-dioxygenase-like lactoylglutathione lyase family enzyme
MLGDKDATPTVAVKDLAAAKSFYEGTLGLTPARSEEKSVLTYKAGRTVMLVYESKYAGTNEATAVTWAVGDDVEGVVRDLKARGVTFEHYDLPGLTRQGDLHVAGKLKNAWFKDPDGNIHSIVNG